MNISRYQGDIPFLTTRQMIEVDRAMVEDYHIELIQMMENAGRSLAHLARQLFLAGDPRDKRAVILAGPGGNGGGALVCARRLYNYGAEVSVIITRSREESSQAASHQLDILDRMEVPISIAAEPIPRGKYDLIVDGIIGYGLKGAPGENSARLIRWANESATPILALDTPSGIDLSTGEIFDPAILAAATMTLALPKEGIRRASTHSFLGDLYLADIGVPPSLYQNISPDLAPGPIFHASDIIRLW